MVVKPGGIGTSPIRYGAGVLALGLLAAAATAYRAHKTGPRKGVGSSVASIDTPADERKAA